VKTSKVQVVSYIDILTGVVRAGRKVAVIGGKLIFKIIFFLFSSNVNIMI
jgi:hypothetical protein